MSKPLKAKVVKKTPCNGCRERKRKCSYEQPCARCLKFNIECTYTVMPSPKDIEYIQELEQMKQIELIQNQITSMENELNTLKLARDNVQPASTTITSTTTTTSTTTSPRTPPLISHVEEVEENNSTYHDYPSPVSMDSVQETIIKKVKQQDFFFPHQDKTKEQLQKFAQHYLPIHSNDSIFACYSYNSEHGNCFTDKQGKRSRVIAKQDSIEAVVTINEEAKPWTLTVKNGDMSIETNITSHADLMSQLKGMATATVYYEKTPSPFVYPFYEESWAPKNAMGTILTILIWRKYGKSRFKSMTKYSPNLLYLETQDQIIQVSQHDIANLTMRIIFTYTQCFHLKMVYLHVPTFVKLFMVSEQHIMQSPAALALCSIICFQPCKHLNEIVPSESLTDYSAYYFEQARELISDRFDEVSLETLLTYTFLAAYQMKSKNDQDADKYLCIAERIYNILLPQYQFKNGAPTSDEAILFSRVYRSLFHLRSAIHLHRIMDNMYELKHHGGPARLFKLLDNENDLEVYISPTDTPKEVEFIQMRQYLRKLRDVIKQGARYASSDDFPTFISIFGHHVEMAMRHWYRNVLPKSFQISLPLFEDDIPDFEFFTQLELECGDNPIPVLTTLDLYNEFLILAKSYIPKHPEDSSVDDEKLLRMFRNMNENIPMTEEEAREVKDKRHAWLKVITKMRHFKQMQHESFTEEELSESDEDYFRRFIKALNPTKLNFDMPLIHTSVRTAINVVRITQFLVTRDYSCYLDLRWVLNAWEILLRAARFEYQQPGDKGKTLDRVRANLLLCLNIVRDHLKLARRDFDGTFMGSLEQEFNKLF